MNADKAKRCARWAHSLWPRIASLAEQAGGFRALERHLHVAIGSFNRYNLGESVPTNATLDKIEQGLDNIANGET
jgi:hypothetical protein